MPNALGDHRAQEKEADRIFSLIVRAPGRCRLCPRTAGLQCAHLFSRRYRATRWNEDNAWCLCSYHHLYYTHHPIEWTELLIRELGAAEHERLRLLALSRTKWHMPVLLLALASRLRALSP